MASFATTSAEYDQIAKKIYEKVVQQGKLSAAEKWQAAVKLLTPKTPFEIHEKLYEIIYEDCAIKPAWIPTKDSVSETNVQHVMNKKGFKSYQEFYEWSVDDTTREEFWKECVDCVDISWRRKPSKTFDLSKGPAHVSYFPGGVLNAAESCFTKRSSIDPALIYAMENAPTEIQTMSFSVLDRLSNQIANAIKHKLKLQPGDAIGICMPMTPESVAIYLGIVKAGCCVVSIADSFSALEIEQRCRLGNAKALFTQDVIYRSSKFLPLFTRILEANDIRKSRTEQDDCNQGADMNVIVLPGMLHAGPYPKLSQMKRSPSGTWDDRDENGLAVDVHKSVFALMREGIDWTWHSFLQNMVDVFDAVPRNAMDPCNILFSSGTTGEPKAIVWSHATPVKCAIDGYLHQDVRVGDRVVWPTNIGWMMGPWLLFQLINGASIGIFNGITSTDAFCQYIEAAQMTMVGVIPSLVKAWQASDATKDCDWSCVRRFSSTGEASQPTNMLWLMSRVPGYAPVMEYCGGTEIGGSYLSSTMVQPNVPSMFSSPVCGSGLTLLNGMGQQLDLPTANSAGDWTARTSGEIALMPPALGLSTHLLNKDHFTVYFADMPVGSNGEVLRRHGDEIELVVSHTHLCTTICEETIPNARSRYFRALGRCDDTMNIGGIKISSVEIERVCNTREEILETAAIAVAPPLGGPSLLVLYVVLAPSVNLDQPDDHAMLKKKLQDAIKTRLNPLFQIATIQLTESLPRTASNKVMRRVLRDEYVKLLAA